MSTIYGILGIQDRDTTVDSIGQRSVYEAIQLLIDRHNADMQAAISVFVEEETTTYQETYWLPGGGQMQESDRLTRPGAVKPIGSYTVAYDLRDARDQVAWDDVSVAYLTLNKLQAATRNIVMRHANWVRFQILKHILNSTNATFVDEVRGSLTIRRLANTDSTTYPPAVGSDTGADDNHYLESGYAASAISDTNNPYATLKEEIDEHLGMGNFVAFINQAQRAKTEALTNFVPPQRTGVREGTQTAIATDTPAGVPGVFLGRVDDIAVMEWRWIPANYIIAVDMNQPAPLKKRIDEPTGIKGRGRLELVTQQDEFPLIESFWRAREGYGVGNRLGAAVMELGTGGTYSIPAAYA